jgi:HEPN domain-containing protein
VLRREGSLGNHALFQCQQAAEKAIKGFLFWHDEPFGKTHQIDVLRSQELEIDATLTEPLREAHQLTPLAVIVRYPDMPGATMDVGEALAIATTVYEAILERLPAEVRP